MCSCRLCKDIRHLKECGISQDFMDRWLEEGLDAEYNKSVLEGNWPNAVEILERKLAEAKEKQNGTN